jgi:PAS domain S-box-containing protein
LTHFYNLFEIFMLNYPKMVTPESDCRTDYFMKNSLETRIAVFLLAFLFVTILVHAVLDIEGFRRDYINHLALESHTMGLTIRENIERGMRSGADPKAMTGVADLCRSLLRANPEMAYCAITDTDGKFLFSSNEIVARLDFDSIQRTVTTGSGALLSILKHRTTFYDAVTSVTFPDGKAFASIHVGFDSGYIVTRRRAIILRSAIILTLSVLVAFFLAITFAKRNIIAPISALLRGVKRISEGSFDTRIPNLSSYEFDELAKSVNLMAESLRNREEEIGKTYRDQQQAHKKLHASYLKLENMSIELERSEELYKSLMEESSDAIMAIDDNETVKLMNRMAEDFFGYSTDEIEGLPLTKLFLLLNVEDLPRIHRLFLDALDGKHVSDEMHFVNKEGASLLAKFTVRSIRSDERLIQAIFQDITRERDTLRNLEKSASDLARLNRMKDTFLGLASHELKTPLTVIMGYSELILTDMAPGTDTAVLEMVRNIATAAARLDNIVKDMVDVSMIDERRMQLKIETVDINRLITASVDELRFFISMRCQNIVMNLDETIPTIKGDSLRLMQLLSNILGNAIKFTPDGGKITVTTSAKYLLRCNRPSNHGKQEQCLYVEITVRDTGIGIDRDEQFRIFDKFYEVGNIDEHSSGKVAFKSKGAGLGLAIAKGIIEMHSGEIWVESPGHDPLRCPGSAFHIFLPTTMQENETTLNYMNFLR